MSREPWMSHCADEIVAVIVAEDEDDVPLAISLRENGGRSRRGSEKLPPVHPFFTPRTPSSSTYTALVDIGDCFTVTLSTIR